jgi:hypothetical protein
MQPGSLDCGERSLVELDGVRLGAGDVGRDGRLETALAELL